MSVVEMRLTLDKNNALLVDSSSRIDD